MEDTKILLTQKDTIKLPKGVPKGYPKCCEETYRIGYKIGYEDGAKAQLEKVWRGN